MEQEIHQVLLQDTKDMITQEDIEGEGETIVEYAETTMEDADQENEEIEDEEDGEESVQFRKVIKPFVCNFLQNNSFYSSFRQINSLYRSRRFQRT